MREVPEKKPFIELTDDDKALFESDPVAVLERVKARAQIAVLTAYDGASRSRRALSAWSTTSGDADTDILPDLPYLRQRSRDLCRNNPLATGAINTKVTSIVGTGLQLQCRIDRNILKMTEEAATAWETRTEAEWELFCKYCDTERTLQFSDLQELALRSAFENGDVFVTTPRQKRPNTPYGLTLQLIEADRVCNADSASDTELLSGGIEKDESGAPVRCHIMKGHPGNLYSVKKNEWQKVDFFGEKTGRRNVLHLLAKKRIGQTRGVPDLAPVIEVLKQLGRYTEAEVTAAVISSFFTVFIKSEYGAGLDIMEPQTEVGGRAGDKDYKLASGAILGLASDESIETANPSRPNPSFDPFVQALLRQVGVALELPFEILIKHFTASYSAARAAILEAWRYFMRRRKWLADSLCRPVYELFMDEAVALGRIYAPGFINGDPLIREAYLGSKWNGPGRGQINELDETKAADARVKGGFSTIADETAAMNGGDWEENHVQRAKEKKRRVDDSLEPTLEMEYGKAPVV